MPFDTVRKFETKLSEYTGAPYVVTVDSCSNALLLCCYFYKVKHVRLPKRTYFSAANSVVLAGGKLQFIDYNWKGIYYLEPYPIVDSARRFTSNMYIPGTLMCVSFHGKKILNLGRGGAILTDNPNAAKWLKQARFDGRNEGVPTHEDQLGCIGYHCYMTPEQAARGLQVLSFLPKENPDLPNDQDPDLSQQKVLQEYIVHA